MALLSTGPFSFMSNLYTRNCEIKPGVLFPEGMQRVALGVEYQGAGFNGFQKQTATDNTVQAHLERALSQVANETVTLVCAGRTDAGVHASEQVVHFDTLAKRPPKAWIEGVNTQLPDEIRVHWAQDVAESFHARFAALARTYRYVLVPTKVRPACLSKQVTCTRYDLDVERMQCAAALLEGEHDFSAFRSSQCQANNPVRTISYIRFSQPGQFVVMEIKANAFLHHMVRNIVGCLLDVGRGARDPAWMRELLAQRDRTLASPTARPWGLYFVRADYPEAFALPHQEKGPLFLPSQLSPSVTVP